MSLNVRPVVSALRRNRTGALLVVLEIAIALAVMVNAAWIVAQRVHEIDQPTGIDYRNIFAIGMSGIGGDFEAPAAEQQDLAYLRSLPGVVSAMASSAVPLAPHGQGGLLWRDPDQRGPSLTTRSMEVDEHGLDTLGVHLIAGRSFGAADVVPYSTDLSLTAHEVLITQSLARKLVPHGSALGKPIYLGDGSMLTVIGITSDFVGSVVRADPTYDVLLFPQTPGADGTYFLLVRTQPGRAEALMQTAVRHLAPARVDRVIYFAHPLQYFKQRLDADNRNVAIFLASITALVLAIACLGIFGLATFNVSTRTKQIGTMRAVGARKRDVVAHFMIENAIVLTAGVLTGCTLALGIAYWLTAQYQLPRLDLFYLAIGVFGVAVIGQLAAWQPARRAASVPPSVATRTI
ncbi:MAG TPA: FtsX-like permease family protein [Steroidobacteraceae bacterium]|nr:FtsX-like permease family protein [Steroidobacteraceae bacterium]